MSTQTLSPQAAFDQGVSEYNSGNFEAARDLFLSIRKEGFTSADLELNLSKAFFKTADTVSALTHAQAGVFLSRVNVGAREDLKFLQKSVPAGYGQSLDHPAEWSWRIQSVIRPSEAGAFAAFFLFLFLLGALLRRKLWSRPSIGLFSVSVLLALLAVAGLPARRLAMVTREAAELRSTPIESAEATLKLPAGSRVRIRQARGEFIEIERPNAFRGWIKKDAIARLL